ncbi:MAG: RlpA-like protein [Bacteroidetes bacterium]|nr:RlpA-like protein [Bacteroidota bacterium]
MVNKLLKFYFLFFILLFSIQIFSQEKFGKSTLDKKATYYHDKFVNRKTSTGELFSQTKYTAAHKTIPLNTLVKVTNKKNGRSIIVRINDRCKKKGVIDLTLVAAKRIQMIESGSIPVKVEVISNDYYDIWAKQDEIFGIFDRAQQIDSVKSAVFDSLIFAKRSNIEESYLFAYYIRLATADSQDNARLIINQLPEKYKYISRVVKAKGQKFYYVNIGPFVSSKTANQALEELKAKYSFAHILEKKNT